MGAAQFPIILTYHSISNGNSPLKVSPALFAEQMQWLRVNAQVASLDAVVTPLSAHKPLPPRTVVLTFDDGYRDFYVSAAPVLHCLGLPAIVFLPTNFCGRTNGWSGQPAWVGEEALMDWPQIAELSRQDICFGGHSVTHPDLTKLPSAEAEREIVLSKAQIEEQTGRQVHFFAYPYGRWNAGVRDLVRRHYRGACSTGAGAVQPDADPLALPRVDVHYLRQPALFRRLFTRTLLSYVSARRMVRGLRGQPEGGYARI